MGHHFLNSTIIQAANQTIQHLADSASQTKTAATEQVCTPSFQLGRDYGLCLLVCSLIAFECILTGFIVVGGRRKKIFSEDLLGSFDKEHRDAGQLGDIKKSQGYPDTGNGRYSSKLSYSSWLEFNQAQRVHYNFVEVITPIILFVLLGGLFYPLISWIVGLTFFVSRIFFTWYVSPQGAGHPLRIAGALLGDVSLLTSFILSVLSALKFACFI